jgi:hypothetical protein
MGRRASVKAVRIAKAKTMTTRVRVACIRKRDRTNPHERIEGIGGQNPSGSSPPNWYMLEDVVIAAIRSKIYDFYVSVGGREVAVVVANHNNRDYLKTTADGYAPNNLLSLPDCPRS